MFHCFSDEDRPCYIKNIEYLIKPGGLYIQLCFSEKETQFTRPRYIKKSDLNQLFSPATGWTIESIQDTAYELVPVTPIGKQSQAYCSLIRRNKRD